MNAAPAQAFSDATPNQNPYSRAGTSGSILSIPDFRRSDTESGGRKATRTDVGLPTLHYSFSVWGSSRVRGSGFGSPENRINPWFSARHRQRRFTSFRCGGTHAPRHHHRYSSAVIATQNGLYLVVT